MGVDSSSTSVVSRSSSSVRGRMSAAISTDTTASARVHPVVAMTTAATRTATEPSASFATSRNAARVLRLARRPRRSTAIETRLPTRPTAPKTSIGPEDTAGGSSRRRTPSTSTNTPTASSTAAWAVAASTSART